MNDAKTLPELGRRIDMKSWLKVMAVGLEKGLLLLETKPTINAARNTLCPFYTIYQTLSSEYQ